MKLVILAGGLGTRISEETHLKPKPMIEIGGKPIIWHIMKLYSSHGVDEFIICCGYKGYFIKEYFANYFIHTSDVTFDLKNDLKTEIHTKRAEPWKVTLVDTGDLTETAGRLAKVQKFLNSDDFCFTYGDGVSDVNITDLINYHKKEKKSVTLTAVQPPARFGALEFEENSITNFIEKPLGDKAWINGGFFVVNPSVIDFIKNDSDSWEHDILPKIANEKNLSGYKHTGFWQPMDTLRDKKYLETLWQSGEAPWKSW